MLKDLRKVEFKVYEEKRVDEYGTYEKFPVYKTGYFHKWINESRIGQGYSEEFQVSFNYALIEDEEGNILMMDPKEIKFIKENPKHEYLK